MGRPRNSRNATDNQYLAYRIWPCILRLTPSQVGLMTQNSEVSMPISAGTGQTTCSNCHSVMPSDLRFCRNCGFRLADGLGGYTGTQFNEAAAVSSAPLKKRRKMSGMSWIFVGLLVFFIGAAAFTALVAPVRQGGHTFVSKPDPQSFFGINELQNTDDGVIIGSIDIPNGPADKAGLVGGDVLLTVDGKPIKDDDQFEEMMTSIPTGKTVEVEYIRDGEKKKTQLTTVSKDDSRRLSREFERRPEGRGQFGYEDSDAERVKVPGMNIYGVRLDTILRSRPADIAGVKERDIVIEFDGVPIRTGDELVMRVRRALPYSTVKLVVMRPTSEEENAPLEKIEIPVKMGKQ